MTYREAFDEVASALDDVDVADKSFLLESKAWQHCDGGTPRRTFDWCLWLSAFGWSARASTLGELLRQFAEALPGLVSTRARDALGAADFELPAHAKAE